MHIQATVREQSFTRTLTVINAPQMKGTSNGYRFRPAILELVWSEHFAPGSFFQVDAKVSGPVILEDGTISQTWTSRRFLGDLGIDAGPKWIRRFEVSFRPITSGIGTDTLLGEPVTWS